YSRRHRSTAADLLEAVPDCERAFGVLYHTGPLEITKTAIETGSEQFRRGLYRRVGAVAGIPDEARALCAAWQREDAAAGPAEIKARARLIELLLEAGARDDGEPSLEFLGGLLREETFKTVLSRVTLERFLGLPSVDTVRTWLPLVKLHPYGRYIESFG